MRRNKFGGKLEEIPLHGVRRDSLGHKISRNGIEVDKAKLETIENFPL